MAIGQNSQHQEARPAGTHDVPEMAKLLKCSERHVRRLIDSRAIPGIIRIGRLVRFHAPTIANWLESGCPNPQTRR